MCKTCGNFTENSLYLLWKTCGLFGKFCARINFALQNLWKTLQKSTAFANCFGIFCTRKITISYLKISTFPNFTHKSTTAITNLNNKKEKVWN
jgi:hypothetical protein